jgi:3',5'-nucleoside bisphosphate phosphatase
MTTGQDPVAPRMLLDGYLKTDSRKEIRIPDIMGYKTLKCDLHIHTIFSDGHVTPQERVNEAWREGLDAIALTDHDNIILSYIDADHNRAWEIANTVAARRNMILIRGIEYTRNEPVGHLNFLFIDDANPYADRSLTPEEAITLAADNGAFVMINHSPGLSDFQLSLVEKNRIHAMEVINGRSVYPAAIDFCNSYNLTKISSSDIHAAIHSRYDIDNRHRNLTLVFASDKSGEGIKEALFAGRTLSYADNYLIGKPEYLEQLVRASLLVTNLKMDESLDIVFDVTNISDITYTFESPGGTKVIFPANRAIQVRNNLNNADMIFSVKNTYISSSGHLQLPLSFFIDHDYFVAGENNQVVMPYIIQDLTLIEPGTTVEFHCPTPGAEIRYTLDGSEPSPGSPLYKAPLSLDKSSLITLKAFREGMIPSSSFRVQALLNTLHEAIKPGPLHKGVNFRYYEGRFSGVSEIEKSGKPVKQGYLQYPDISLAEIENFFGIVFSGYIYAPTDGLYEFAVESDDGAVFKISGVRLIDNDGSHSLIRKTGSIKLKKGYHFFELPYFQDFAEKELSLRWTIPGKEEKPVAPEYLFIENLFE